MATTTIEKFTPPKMHRMTIDMTDQEAGALAVALAEWQIQVTQRLNPTSSGIVASTKKALANRNVIYPN